MSGMSQKINTLFTDRFVFTRIAIGMLLIIFLSGCAGDQKQLTDPDLVWPPAPDPPRIRYIKSIYG